MQSVLTLDEPARLFWSTTTPGGRALVLTISRETIDGIPGPDPALATSAAIYHRLPSETLSTVWIPTLTADTVAHTLTIAYPFGSTTITRRHVGQTVCLDIVLTIGGVDQPCVSRLLRVIE